MARRTNRLLAARSACLLALLLLKAQRTRAGLRLRRNAAVDFGLETASGAVSDGVGTTDGGPVGEVAAGGGRVAGEGSSCTEGGDTGSTLVLGAEERALLRAGVLEAMRLAQAAHMGHLLPTHDALVSAPQPAAPLFCRMAPCFPRSLPSPRLNLLIPHVRASSPLPFRIACSPGKWSLPPLAPAACLPFFQVGIMGVITASHDIRAQWRTSTAPKAKAA
eukprot:scaffold10546_cov114-Isochrysis_galbana.AAC.4